MTREGAPAGGVSEVEYLVLVLRLLVDGHGELRQGELVDAMARSVGRFRRIDEIAGLVAAWLALREREPGADGDQATQE